MWMLLALLVGCGERVVEPVDSAPAEVADSDAPETVATDADGPPAGAIISAEPILPKPVVMGGIAASAVEDGIKAEMDAIEACYASERAKNPKLRGKVLVKFTIAGDGRVVRTSTKSTSLRNEAAEACVNERVAAAKFPPLERGAVAIVHYPFVFGG